MRTYVRDLRRPSRRATSAGTAAGYLIAAQQAAFEVPFVPLTAARALVELYAEKGDRKFERAGFRHLKRYMGVVTPSLADVAEVAALLAERHLMMRGLQGISRRAERG